MNCVEKLIDELIKLKAKPEFKISMYYSGFIIPLKMEILDSKSKKAKFTEVDSWDDAISVYDFVANQEEYFEFDFELELSEHIVFKNIRVKEVGDDYVALTGDIKSNLMLLAFSEIKSEIESIMKVHFKSVWKMNWDEFNYKDELLFTTFLYLINADNYTISYPIWKIKGEDISNEIFNKVLANIYKSYSNVKIFFKILNNVLSKYKLN